MPPPLVVPDDIWRHLVAPRTESVLGSYRRLLTSHRLQQNLKRHLTRRSGSARRCLARSPYARRSGRLRRRTADSRCGRLAVHSAARAPAAAAPRPSREPGIGLTADDRLRLGRRRRSRGHADTRHRGRAATDTMMPRIVDGGAAPPSRQPHRAPARSERERSGHLRARPTAADTHPPLVAAVNSVPAQRRRARSCTPSYRLNPSASGSGRLRGYRAGSGVSRAEPLRPARRAEACPEACPQLASFERTEKTPESVRSALRSQNAWKWPSSKPAGRGSPPLGRFDSFAASWLEVSGATGSGDTIGFWPR